MRTLIPLVVLGALFAIAPQGHASVGSVSVFGGSDALSSAGTGSGQMRPPGTYKLQFILLSTDEGAPSTTEATIKEHVAELDRDYNRLTRGLYRFTFESITRGTWTGPLGDCRASGFSTKVGAMQPVVPNGIRVVIVAKDPCIAHAYRPGDFAVVYEFNAEGKPEVGTFFHEIGHSIGLGHANSFLYGIPEISFTDGRTGQKVIRQPAWQPARSNSFQTWVSDVPHLEYGDPSSRMGGRFQLDRLDLAAYELDLLGVYQQAQVASALTSGNFTINDRYATSGTSLLYVPADNARQATVEYWPILGEEGTVRGGVLVRAIFGFGDRGPWALGIRGSFDVDGHAVMQPSKVSFPDGVMLEPGERMDLPDGTSIVVESRDAASAKVKVIRSVDKKAPVITWAPMEGCESTASACSPPC